MIQTKTLKEALKDPGVIEVVEELISFNYMQKKKYTVSGKNVEWGYINVVFKKAGAVRLSVYSPGNSKEFTQCELIVNTSKGYEHVSITNKNETTNVKIETHPNYKTSALLRCNFGTFPSRIFCCIVECLNTITPDDIDFKYIENIDNVGGI